MSHVNGRPASRAQGAEALRTLLSPKREPLAEKLQDGVSGRLFVLVASAVVMVLGAILAMTFLSWRTGRLDLFAYGRTHVAASIAPLADSPPPEIAPETWRRAVEDTRTMLVALTASGMLDRAEMDALRSDIDARVARARANPAESLNELTALWNDVEQKAGPAIAPPRVAPKPGTRQALAVPRPPRPSILPPSPKRAPAKLGTPTND